jgi:D-alanyl-D-alanine carboxypeptidase/D-alanyl-D-alanine-endopeptidase (penicillin-binding protein 4)
MMAAMSVQPASRLQLPIPSCLNGLKRRLKLLVSLATVACMGSLQVACATRPDAVQAHDAVLRAPGTTVALAEQRLPPALATSTRLPTDLLVSLNRAGLPEASFSVWVQGADQATPLLSHLADQPRLMASAMKLVTTGTALRLLGPTFSWRTDMALRGALDTQGVLQGDVHIQASGDPSLDGTRLLAWLQQWREAGLKDIRGQILVDDRVFTLPPHDPSAFDGEALKPYNAGPRAWLLAHGAVSLQVQPDAAHPGWARVVLSPALLGKRVDADVSLDSQAPCGDWRSALRVDWSADAVRVQGRYAMACGVQSWPMLWPESTPGEHSSRVLAGAWAALGGSLAGTTQRMPWPEPPPPVWLSWHSPPLAEVIRDINKFSNNVMARQLFLTLGRLRTDGSLGEVGTLAQARAIATAHVLQVTGLPSGAGNANPPCAGDALQLDNGAGLSRYEGASARCLGSWLATWWQDPLMPELLASLPIAGVDGTARRTQAAVGRAHIKTGSLDNVMAVAGMVQTPDGQRRMVVGVINHPQAEQGRTVMQTLLNWASTNAPTP